MATMISWFARGGGIARTGPFPSQVRAMKAMRLADPPQKAFPFPADVFVWPEVIRTRSVRAKPKSR